MRHALSFATRIMLVAFTLLFVQGDGRAGDGKAAAGAKGKANRLAGETSPYLLLHAHNPVDWYPWGPEAFAKAVAENKPIFLSIGYSSCYWCHVMERESFTDPEIAKALNEKFVAIKVDREERPDVDQVYMAALLTTGRGGWPMSMFLTPDGRPFYGGTYFPPRDREPYGGFLPLINEISRAWKSSRRHAEIEKSANTLSSAARARLEADGRSTAVPLTHLPAAEGLKQLAQQFDPLHGGFGFDPQNYKRPKFPEPSNLMFLLDQQVRVAAERARVAALKGETLKAGAAAVPASKPNESMALKIEAKKSGGSHASGGSSEDKDGDKEKDKDKDKTKDKDQEKDKDAASNSPDPIDPLGMVLLTLDHMARGGIRDHLAGGYHRYSTERSWSVPHFEKMLYDNAQLASVHLAAFAITKDPRWRQEAEATFQFVERRMTSTEGAFFSALDAETEGEEGGYYVWTREQVKAVLGAGPDLDAFMRVYGLTGPSNFAGERYVLREPLPLAEQAVALKTTPEDLEARLVPLRLRLLAARDRRPAPLVDDKILTSWNGLMIAAYAEGYRQLGNERYRKAAETAAGFVLSKMRNPAGRLLRTYRAGIAKIPGYLDDYAFMIHGLLKLHEATHDEKWLRDARILSDIMLSDFEDAKVGGFFFTSTGHDTLLARAKDPADNVLPSGNSIAILDLVELSRFTGVTEYLDHAHRALDAFSGPLLRSPAMVPAMLVSLERYLDARPPARASGSSGLAMSPERASDASVVTAVASVDKPGTAYTAGSEVLVSVNLSVAKGWHIYGNPPGVVDLKPTTVELDRSSGTQMQLLGVVYPAGEATQLGSLGNEKVALYAGKVGFHVRLKLASPLEAGNVKLRLVVHYQACNDRFCLAPATLEVPVEVRVGR